MCLRVYLVEDSPIITKLLRELIGGIGATIVGVADGATAAIADIPRRRPDVVLIDIVLREGSGFDVLKALRNRFGDKGPARIVLTNYTLDGYRATARRLGAEHFFDKSVQIHEMLGTLRGMSHSADKSNGSSM
jgi:CheY-like chemotaxis protein